MRFPAAAAILVSLLPAQAVRAQTLSVTGVRHWQLGDVTRIAVEVSGEFKFRSDRLHNPERVYFDILNARPRIDSKRGYTEMVSDSLLKRVRVAETTPGITRIVLDLADGVEATPSLMINPSRLIVELSITAPAAPPVISTLPAAAPPVADTPPPLVLAVPPVLAKVETNKPLDLSTLSPPSTPASPVPAKRPRSPEVARSAKVMSTGDSSLVRALGLKINRIVIDAGHGGHDEGTMGPKGLLEKDLVLDVAQRVGKLIGLRMGSEVIYTRTDDTFIPLEGRTQLANDKKADLFLSIHANSSPAAPGVTGIETYYLNFTESKDSLAVAARENATSQQSVFDLRDIIQKITLHDKVEESREFAERIQASLFALSARNFPGEKNRGVRKAPFVVLIGASMPSVLAEIGFLTNPKEESLLRRPDYRQKIAEALYRGIARYSDGLSHFQVAKN
jgi:N-acetylmuramoyl-L-alanine amidase